jgi:hypothetical protein
MDSIYKMVRSTIHVLLCKPDYLMPEDFGSGCLINYRGKCFFLSVAHVTNKPDLKVYLETNLPPEDGTSPIQPIGGLFTFNVFKINDITDSKELIDKLDNPTKPIDITFAEIKTPIKLICNKIDFGSFIVEESNRIIIEIGDVIDPNEDETYGFFGNIRQDYKDKYLVRTPTLKYPLKYHHGQGKIMKFTYPEKLDNKKDFEGCSGAPILDSKGNLVALACTVATGSKIIIGYPIRECLKLIDMTINTNQL